MLLFKPSRWTSAPSTAFRILERNFTSHNAAAAAQMPPRPVLKEDDIREAFLKGSGPGGQKIVRPIVIESMAPNCTSNHSESSQNKTASAVQLKHLPTGTVIKSQATRSRAQNRKIARRLLAERIEAVEKGPESRVELKAEIKRKKKASKSKKARRKYKASGNRVEDGGGRNEDEEESDEDEEEKVKEERV